MARRMAWTIFDAGQHPCQGHSGFACSDDRARCAGSRVPLRCEGDGCHYLEEIGIHSWRRRKGFYTGKIEDAHPKVKPKPAPQVKGKGRPLDRTRRLDFAEAVPLLSLVVMISMSFQVVVPPWWKPLHQTVSFQAWADLEWYPKKRRNVTSSEEKESIPLNDSAHHCSLWTP